ncbi:MAG TPA: urease subunit gamma [Candidatus Nitrosopolaris sp.]|nr:urease subunit gamma [Candidatus Nitrosopolaris sp.]
MILIKAQVKGEPDVPLFSRVYEYRDKFDEQIFFDSLEKIKNKLAKNMRINTNESLIFYCGYIVDQLRAHISIESIEKNAAKLLLPNNVMIGVPETLKRISFELVLDNFPKKKLSFHNPIPTTSFSMAVDR